MYQIITLFAIAGCRIQFQEKHPDTILQKYANSETTVAMVCVAAIALASSTYAWFVSNNKVTGTTTNISAQSNSAYLVIDQKATSKDSTSSTTYQKDDSVIQKALYPAQVTANGIWQSAYGIETGKSDEQADTRFTIKSKGQEDGSAAAAVAEAYAITHKFYIGTGTYDGEFTDLVVTGMTLTAPASAIANAMRVLVKCGDNWQVWKYDSEQQKGVKVTTYKTTEPEEVSLSGQADKLYTGTIESGTDAEVDVYIYYDGADSNIFSDHLTDLTNNCGVTLTFEATPTTHGTTGA